jgi:hypothetical protein
LFSNITLAASACAELETGDKDDWFLPSRNELNQLYIERAYFVGLSGSFWSSSQVTNMMAWYQNFANGNWDSYSKSTSINVRAVRAF